jgi:hypothetical protein
VSDSTGPTCLHPIRPASTSNELFSIRYRNTMSGGTRNLIIEHGLVSFVTSYHKGYSVSGSTKLIHRYLNPELSQIVVQYLAVIRPFVEQLRNLAYGQTNDSAFFWFRNDNPWSTSRLSTFFAAETKAHIGADSSLSIASWRHIAVAVSREHLPKGEHFDRLVDKHTMAGVDQLAGHAVITAAMTYGRLASDGQGEIGQFRQRYRHISIAWQKFWLGAGNVEQVEVEDAGVPPEYNPTRDPPSKLTDEGLAGIKPLSSSEGFSIIVDDDDGPLPEASTDNDISSMIPPPSSPPLPPPDYASMPTRLPMPRVPST